MNFSLIVTPRLSSKSAYHNVVEDLLLGDTDAHIGLNLHITSLSQLYTTNDVTAYLEYTKCLGQLTIESLDGSSIVHFAQNLFVPFP